MRPKQVGRPVDADSDATRRKIFESASRCFSTYGYGKATMREIAEMAGLTPPAVYYYFPSKLVLIEALIEAYDATFVPQYQRAAEEHSTFSDRLKAFVRIGATGTSFDHFGNTIYIDGVRYPELRTAVERSTAAYEDLYRRVVTEAIDAGELPPELHVEGMVKLLRALFYGMGAIVRTSSEDLRPVMADCLAVLLDPTRAVEPTGRAPRRAAP